MAENCELNIEGALVDWRLGRFWLEMAVDTGVLSGYEWRIVDRLKTDMLANGILRYSELFIFSSLFNCQTQNALVLSDEFIYSHPASVKAFERAMIFPEN
jgi:hypothetical protein